MKFPCKVYYPREPKQGRRPEPDKVLTAKDQDELNGMLAVGWKLEAAVSE